MKTEGLAPAIKTEMTELKLKESQMCIEHLEMKKNREVQAMAFEKEKHEWEKKEHDFKAEKHTWDRERFFWEQERIQSAAIKNQYLVSAEGAKLPDVGVVIAVDEGTMLPTDEVVIASESTYAPAN